ncbi:hypothetical protein [Streptomyces scabiei]|nr:hypothetical protein [Streptomyces scabiei]MDX3114810.1 hypothetical protein [Streptomyces scabiei]
MPLFDTPPFDDRLDGDPPSAPLAGRSRGQVRVDGGPRSMP